MNNAWKNRLLLTADCLLAAGGLAFLILSIVRDQSNQTHLTIGLGCVALAGLISLVRLPARKTDGKDQTERVG